MWKRLIRRLWKRLYISKKGDLLWFEATYPFCVFTLFPFSTLLKMSHWGLKRFKETSYRDCDALEKKLLLVKWLIIWKDKIKEGLGIRGWSSLNGALLGKWNWRCFLREKHSGNRSFRRSMKREKAVRVLVKWKVGYGGQVMENYQKWIRPFQKQSILEVGNDRRVKFWKDKWRVNKPLSVIPWSLGVLLFDVFNILILLT